MQVTKLLGLAAVGALLVLAAPTERAQALSLSNPGAAAAVQHVPVAGDVVDDLVRRGLTVKRHQIGAILRQGPEPGEPAGGQDDRRRRSL